MNAVLREATAADIPALEGFLARHSETSMFLRGNLAAHGLGHRDHRHATTYWLSGAGRIDGVIGCSNGGYLMCQAPVADASFWRSACDAVCGRKILGLTGVPAQVEAWIAALDLPSMAFSMRDVEPLYRLALDDLVDHDRAGLHLRAPVQSDMPMLNMWFEGYMQDTGLTPTGVASGSASALAFVAHPAARVLLRDGIPVAMTSLNAQLADIVQIGGVYVPPDMRGQGLAGAAVGAQLLELRETGVQTAILFAANAAAARAYVRIGFSQIGSYQVCLLRTPLTVERNADVLPS